MSAPTTSVEWLLARAAMRTTGLLHVVSQRNSGALNPICGARTISSEKIEKQYRLDDVALLCEGWGTIATSMGGTVMDGVAHILGLSTAGAPTARLLEVPLATINVDCALRDPGDELVNSVATNGVKTPIDVRRTTMGLQLVSGSRRLAAARAAGLTTIPAIVRDLDDQQTTIDALLANLHRQDLNPIAQAQAFVDALTVLDVTQDALADGLGISRPQISNTVRLLQLPDHLKDHIAAGRVTAAHGRALLRLNDNPDAQDELADQILNDGMTTKDADAVARRTARQDQPQDEQLLELSRLIAEQLTVKKVQVKPVAHGKQIVLTVTDADFPRILAQFTRAAR